jgi:hypothetical protein
VTQEEIELAFASAGWELNATFNKHLIMGYTQDLSIVAYRHAWEADEDNPEFQLSDHGNSLSCWVKEIPTPQGAAEVLKEYGQLITEE